MFITFNVINDLRVSAYLKSPPLVGGVKFVMKSIYFLRRNLIGYNPGQNTRE